MTDKVSKPEPQAWVYSAAIIVPSVGVHAPHWQVKRWTDDPNEYQQALISLHTNNPQSAIEAAIAGDFWGPKGAEI
jgi:hypothetical protein